VAGVGRGEQLHFLAHGVSLGLLGGAFFFASTLMPFFSMVRMALALRRSSHASSSARTLRVQFGGKRRFFLLLACETRLPTVGRLP
jgi:hypothetical protein